MCEFCGKEKICEATTFNGWYCKDCYKLLIEESKEAIREIEQEQSNKKEE